MRVCDPKVEEKEFEVQLKLLKKSVEQLSLVAPGIEGKPKQTWAMFFKNQIRMEENPSLYTGARAAVPVASEVQKRRVEKVIDQLKIAYEKLAESSQER